MEAVAVALMKQVVQVVALPHLLQGVVEAELLISILAQMPVLSQEQTEGMDRQARVV